MYPIEVLPEDLRTKSGNSRHIVLDVTNALPAIDILAAANWAVCSWEGHVLVLNELQTIHHIRYETKNKDLLCNFQVQWQIAESWEEYVQRAAVTSKATIQKTQELLNQLNERAAYFKIEALAPHPYVEKITSILSKNFSEERYLTVEAANKTVPLIAAALRQATRSFSAEQLVYI